MVIAEDVVPDERVVEEVPANGARDIPPETRWPLLRESLALALISRVMLFGVVWYSLRIFPRLGRYPEQLPDDFLPNQTWLDGWARWDASHYVAVAELGYGDPASPSHDGGVGFFPLFPLLMRGTVTVLGIEPTKGALAAAAIVIANLCFLLSVPLLARLASEQVGVSAARNAVVVFCLSPFAYFFSAAYSESLFVLLVIGALLLARQGRWWWAGAVAGLASGTRLVGLAVAPALLWMAWRRGARLRDLAAVAVLSPLGLVAYFGYLWWEFDNLFAYFDAQAHWGGWDEHVRFWAELFVRQPREVLLGDPRNLVIVLNVALGLLCLALLPLVWKKLDPATALCTVLLVVVQFVFTWQSLGRYLLPAVGIYLVLGLLLTEGRWAGLLRDAVIAGMTIAMAVFAVLYAHGFWII